MIAKLIGQRFLYASEAKLNKDWRILKQLATKAVAANELEEAFRLLAGLGKIGYQFNFLETFTDAEVDHLITELANRIDIWPSPFTPDKKRVVFYDFFTLENRGFTQQYLDVIIRNNFHILYIGTNESEFHDNNEIIRTLKEYGKAQIVTLPAQLANKEKLQLAVNNIAAFCPSKIFIHNAPWDILSCLIAAVFKPTGVKSYLINITDHSYWPGAAIFDFIIDFRKYGTSLNHYCRGINLNQLITLPTPAHQLKEEPFKEFDIDLTNKVIGFGGGSTYKIIDDNNTFLNLVKRIIGENPQFVFLFANVGEHGFIKKFIADHGLEKQFYLIGNRKDINKVFSKIDIYFNTFPYGGGLMINYAIANNKPVLALNNPELLYTRIDMVIDKELDDEYLIYDEEKYVETANNLIRDKEYRTTFANIDLDYGIIKVKFMKGLTQLLCDEKMDGAVLCVDFKVNPSAVAAFHINCDNLFTKEYQSLRNIYFSNLPVARKTLRKIEYYIFKGLKKMKLL